MNEMTGTKVIQVWFAAVALVVVAAVAFGAQVNVASGGILLTFSLVPPLIVFLLRPEAQSPATADAIRRTDERT